ncbi:hypothetical protein KCP76_15060 [Salmonella enterica subsp. enterica serovar Weltevreden]|nr:hypothetical protein KCP76_15060 [Salmonella enterica subsp. enterica serovar Weltevreden]
MILTGSTADGQASVAAIPASVFGENGSQIYTPPVTSLPLSLLGGIAVARSSQNAPPVPPPARASVMGFQCGITVFINLTGIVTQASAPPAVITQNGLRQKKPGRRSP